MVVVFSSEFMLLCLIDLFHFAGHKITVIHKSHFFFFLPLSFPLTGNHILKESSVRWLGVYEWLPYSPGVDQDEIDRLVHQQVGVEEAFHERESTYQTVNVQFINI